MGGYKFMQSGVEGINFHNIEDGIDIGEDRAWRKSRQC